MTEVKSLWQDYLFLTKEIERFLSKKEYDLCFELMNQRESLQSQLDAVTDDFRLTAEGRQLLSDIRNRNQTILQGMHAALRVMQQQQSISSAYDGYGSNRPVGNRLDQKR
ncbi:MAG: hypothetical protein K0Q77_1680 [Anaerosporomusa subterranea]|jgi:hypothetical protein|nr:hypothetical protein [Anaerosporomusa subterranea]